MGGQGQVWLTDVLQISVWKWIELCLHANPRCHLLVITKHSWITMMSCMFTAVYRWEDAHFFLTTMLKWRYGRNKWIYVFNFKDLQGLNNIQSHPLCVSTYSTRHIQTCRPGTGSNRSGCECVCAVPAVALTPAVAAAGPGAVVETGSVASAEEWSSEDSS